MALIRVDFPAPFADEAESLPAGTSMIPREQGFEGSHFRS